MLTNIIEGEQNGIGEQNVIVKKKIRRKTDMNNLSERKKKKKEEEIIVMPTYESYNSFLNNKFTGLQLKQICKYYKLNVTGTKQILTNVIYKHLFLSCNAS